MIKVDDDYFIDVDPLNYIAYVIEDSYDKKSESIVRRQKLIGYYPNAFKALEAIRNYKIRKCIWSGDKTIEEAICEVRRLDMEFLERLKEVTK